MRQIYRDAGVRVYLDTDDCFYADNQWVGVHAAEAGPRVLHLPAGAAVRSVLRDFSAEGPDVRLDLPAYYTELLRVIGEE